LTAIVDYEKMKFTFDVTLIPMGGVMRRSLAIIILILGISVTANAQSLQYVNSTLWGGIGSYKINGDYAYFSMRNGLAVMKLTPPEPPQFISYLYFDGQGQDIDISGDYAYLADGTGCLQIADISNPLIPVAIGGFHQYCNASRIVVAGSYAYLAGGGYMAVINIEDPTNPIFAGSANWSCNDIAAAGNYLYLAATGLKVLDISDPANPVLAGAYYDDMTYNSIQVVNNIIYCAIDYYGLKSIDITDPHNPLLLGISQPIDDLQNLYISGNRGYVTQQFGGLGIFNISDPYTLVLDTVLVLPNSTTLLAGDPQHLLLTNSNLGICYYSISQPDNPVLTSSAPLAGGADKIVIDGNYAYATNIKRDLFVVDKSRLDYPSVAGACTTGIYVQDMIATNNHLLAVGNHGLRIFDITDPHNPYLCSRYSTIGSYRAIAINGDYAYLIAPYDNLTVLNIHDFVHPQFIQIDSSIFANDIDVAGDYAYIAKGDWGMQVLSLADPAYPVVYGDLDRDHVSYFNIKADGSYLYATTSSNKIDVIDVADPAHPAYAVSLNTYGSVSDFDISDVFLYAVGPQIGLRLYYIADPLNPLFLDSYQSPGQNNYVAIDEFNIFIADYYSIVILGITPYGISDNEVAPYEYSLNQNFPNPFNAQTTFSYDLPKSGAVSLSIYDITGRKIAEPLNTFMSAGTHSFTWDAKNFSSGVYFARLEYGGSQSSIKMILLK
jgi:hypothetical protein